MAKISIYEMEFLKPEEKTVGTIVKILDEAKANPKFKAIAACAVELNGEKKLFTFNKTTVKNCQIAWGIDSIAWIGQSLKSEGEKKMGNMIGTEWTPI